MQLPDRKGEPYMFTPVRTENVADKMVDQILSRIQSGELSAGDRLPGERLLAEQFGVSRVPVREALRTLKAMGILEVHPGVGAIITGDVIGALANDIWMRWLSEHQEQLISVLEVREAMDAKVAALAAERATPAQIQELRELVDRMEQAVAVGDVNALERNDRDFHTLIARISGNELFVRLEDALNQVITLDRRATFRLPGRQKESLGEHRAILEAIAAGESRTSAQLASSHLQSVIKLVRQART
jgi:GntR family transcriptional repressor for pyruvate dehydrogenase complex